MLVAPHTSSAGAITSASAFTSASASARCTVVSAAPRREDRRTMNGQRFDVAIIGGGLAGGMAATLLQRRGLRTVVWSRAPSISRRRWSSARPSPRAPACSCATNWASRTGSRPTPTASSASTSSPCRAAVTPAQLRRVPRAAALAHAAGEDPRHPASPHPHVPRRPPADEPPPGPAGADAGAAWMSGTSVDHVDFDGSEATGGTAYVHYRTHTGETGESGRLGASFVIDCSGRRAALARQLGIPARSPRSTPRRCGTASATWAPIPRRGAPSRASTVAATPST